MSPDTEQQNGPANGLPKHHDSTFRHRWLRIRLAHHRHSGRHLPFYCTSYAALFSLIIFTGTLVFFVSHSVRAIQESGSVNISANIPSEGPAPEVPAKITSPPSGSHFTNPLVGLEGTCLDFTTVEIYRDQVFAGSAYCQDGRFALTITLTPGKNLVFAKIRDASGRYGPDSSTIVLYLDQAQGSGQTAADNSFRYQNPLLVYVDPVQPRAQQNTVFRLSYEINGDRPPYAVSIDWGDGSAPDLLKHDGEGDFAATHSFVRSGQTTIRIKVIGAAGGQAAIQTLVYVASDGSAVLRTCPGGYSSLVCAPPAASDNGLAAINALWIAVLVTALMTVSFWLGEKALYRRLSRQPETT